MKPRAKRPSTSLPLLFVHHRSTVCRAKLKNDYNLDVKYVHLELTDAKSVVAARDLIERAEGRLDVLVNNAGEFIDSISLKCSIYIRHWLFRRQSKANRDRTIRYQ